MGLAYLFAFYSMGFLRIIYLDSLWRNCKVKFGASFLGPLMLARLLLLGLMELIIFIETFIEKIVLFIL